MWGNRNQLGSSNQLRMELNFLFYTFKERLASIINIIFAWDLLQIIMGTHTNLLYHIVFSTYRRKKTIHKERKKILFSYVNTLLKNKNCHLYRVNAVEDHIHIFTHMHQSLSIASLVKDIKLSSNTLIKGEKLFEGWEGWQEGYGAFTVEYSRKDSLIEYIKNQEEHHKTTNSLDELKIFLTENGVSYDEKYLL